ncbi:maternal protein exuperantia-like [Chelonus insularis]|uniref:maternal protein exuperantia-like n=1 Tax=Chelonus insularis TaxID=460826 RepID=UPI00158BBAE9|nr:maternal protein exuperantia-like [Chelonus insularis]
MVSSTTVENGDTVPSIKASPAEGIPPGNYRLVGLDIDATGRKFVDEICQIAGYTSKSKFAQYVMPFRNLNLAARKRHNLKVVTIGKYRVLKSSRTNSVLKTKSEISAISDFLSWLEEIKKDNEDGIILVHHESRKVIPVMLLDSLMKYKLLERFKKTVKGFVNGFDVATSKCANTLQAFSLRTLSHTLLNEKDPCDNAETRARLVYKILQHLSNDEENAETNEGKEKDDATSKATIEFIREFVQPVEAEEKEHEIQKLMLEREYSLKPIFRPLVQMSRRERHHATRLRGLLAESYIDYTQLKEAWAAGQKEALEKMIKEKVAKATVKEKEDLIEVLECHFDPEKKPKINIETDVKKKTKKTQNVKNSKDVSGTESPDTTTVHSPPQVKTEVVEQESTKVLG